MEIDFLLSMSEPPSFDILKDRIKTKEHIEKRIRVAKVELKQYKAGKYDKIIDLKVVSKDGHIDKITKLVLKKYLKSIS